jgi:hypothetical protein
LMVISPQLNLVRCSQAALKPNWRDDRVFCSGEDARPAQS